TTITRFISGTRCTRRPGGKHPLEGDPRWKRDVVGDGDLVEHRTLEESVENPGEVTRVDAVHGRTRADHRVEAEDRVLRVVGSEPLHEVDLRADREGGSGGCRLDRLADVVG